MTANLPPLDPAGVRKAAEQLTRCSGSVPLNSECWAAARVVDAYRKAVKPVEQVRVAMVLASLQSLSLSGRPVCDCPEVTEAIELLLELAKPLVAVEPGPGPAAGQPQMPAGWPAEEDAKP